MPISKRRNKHIQRVLIEAAKLAPRESHELALTHARELERGNRNRATLAVPRKMLCYTSPSSADSRTSCLPRSSAALSQCKNLPSQGESRNIGILERAGCQVPPIADWARNHIPRPLRIVSGLAENTNSIICDGSSGLRQQMDVWSCRGCRDHQPRGTHAQRRILIHAMRALRARQRPRVFPLDFDLHGGRQSGELPRLAPAGQCSFWSVGTMSSTQLKNAKT
jgi:hypothetical protein